MYRHREVGWVEQPVRCGACSKAEPRLKVARDARPHVGLRHQGGAEQVQRERVLAEYMPLRILQSPRTGLMRAVLASGRERFDALRCSGPELLRPSACVLGSR